jgi:membrane-associated phospholipid phosphatase
MTQDAAAAQAWAQWLGQHALNAYGAGLLGVLAATALCFVALRRWTVRAQHSTLPPALFLGLRLAVGFGIVVVAAVVFAEMARALNASEALGQFDSRLAAVLSQTLSPTVLRWASIATHLGDPIILTAVVAVVTLLLLWRRRRWLALGWWLACVGNGLLNQALKRIFARVRPPHEHGFAVADGFSFPSGHSSGALMVYGMLAYLGLRLLPPRWHLPGVLAAAALAFSMGVSRVLLQVHWASDVVAGFASGLAWLVVCVLSIEMLRHYRRT